MRVTLLNVFDNDFAPFSKLSYYVYYWMKYQLLMGVIKLNADDTEQRCQSATYYIPPQINKQHQLAEHSIVECHKEECKFAVWHV